MILSTDEFVQLRDRNNERATRDCAPECVWLEIIAQHPEMKKWVVHNKTVPQSVLEMLADDPEPEIRFAVAMKRKTPSGLLEKPARDRDESVRLQVARNPKTPVHVLSLLTEDPSVHVAEIAAARLHPANDR
jgi:hypothetical protein